MMKNANTNVIFTVTTDPGIGKIPYLIVFETGAQMYQERKLHISPSVSRGNRFRFVLKNQPEARYFSIFLPGTLFDLPVVKEFHFEPGDLISIIIRKTQVPNVFDVQFSGTGAAKYQCKKELSGLVHRGDPGVSFLEVLRKHINSYRVKLSAYSFDLLHADVIACYGAEILEGMLKDLVVLLRAGEREAMQQKAAAFFGDFCFDFTENLTNDVLCASRPYAQLLMTRIYCKCLASHLRLHQDDIIAEINKVNFLPLRGKLLANFRTGYHLQDYRLAAS